ncbi:3872_t:CDS:1, partial [Dentiscutata erythropus]
MIPIPPLLLFPGLVVGFSVLFTSTIYKSESICSDNTMKSKRSSRGKLIQPIFVKNIFKLHLSALSRNKSIFNFEFMPLSYFNTTISSFLLKINIKKFLAKLNLKIVKKTFYFAIFLMLLFCIIFFSCPDITSIVFRAFSRRARFHFVASTMKKILLLHLMFKFNPVTPKDGNESLFNHHDKFNDLSKDTNESSNPSASDQFNTIIVETSLYEQRNQNIHFSISTIDNAALKKNSFCSNYKIRTNNNLSQSLDFEVFKIIESSLSIHYNQFYKVPSPENLIIGLHYCGYSASDIEIKYSKFLSLRALKSKEVSDRLNQQLKSKEVSDRLKSKEASDQLNQASDRFNSTSKLNANHMIIPKSKNIGLNYEAVEKIENYE